MLTLLVSMVTPGSIPASEDLELGQQKRVSMQHLSFWVRVMSLKITLSSPTHYAVVFNPIQIMPHDAIRVHHDQS